MHATHATTQRRSRAGDTRSILEAVGPAQSYDIQLMLFVLPNVLLGAITAPAAGGRSRRSAVPAAADGAIVPDGPAAQTAILQEVAAVAARCSGGTDLAAAAAPTAQPHEALHLQAILGALDTLQRCACLHHCMHEGTVSAGHATFRLWPQPHISLSIERCQVRTPAGYAPQHKC